jgi:hypothetical protein
MLVLLALQSPQDGINCRVRHISVWGFLGASARRRYGGKAVTKEESAQSLDLSAATIVAKDVPRLGVNARAGSRKDAPLTLVEWAISNKEMRVWLPSEDIAALTSIAAAMSTVPFGLRVTPAQGSAEGVAVPFEDADSALHGRAHVQLLLDGARRFPSNSLGMLRLVADMLQRDFRLLPIPRETGCLPWIFDMMRRSGRPREYCEAAGSILRAVVKGDSGSADEVMRRIGVALESASQGRPLGSSNSRSRGDEVKSAEVKSMDTGELAPLTIDDGRALDAPLLGARPAGGRVARQGPDVRAQIPQWSKSCARSTCCSASRRTARTRSPSSPTTTKTRSSSARSARR